MDPKDPSKGVQRDHWQKSDSPDAREALTEPPFPEDVAYLYERAKELHGRSGVSMAGLLPVSHQEIAAYSALTGWVPNALELDAVRTLDAVMLHPDKAQEPEPVERPARPWPVRKA